MATTSISIEVPNLEPEEIKNAVVEAIVHQTLYTKAYDPEDPDDTEGYRLNTTFTTAIHEQVRSSLKEQTAALVPGLVEQILEERVIITSEYGERRGEKTMREIVAEEFQTQKRDVYSSSRHKESQIDKIVRATVAKEIEGEVKKVVEERLDVVREAIQEELGKVTAQALEKALKLHGSVAKKTGH